MADTPGLLDNDLFHAKRLLTDMPNLSANSNLAQAIIILKKFEARSPNMAADALETALRENFPYYLGGRDPKFSGLRQSAATASQQQLPQAKHPRGVATSTSVVTFATEESNTFGVQGSNHSQHAKIAIINYQKALAKIQELLDLDSLNVSETLNNRNIAVQTTPGAGGGAAGRGAAASARGGSNTQAKILSAAEKQQLTAAANYLKGFLTATAMLIRDEYCPALVADTSTSAGKQAELGRALIDLLNQFRPPVVTNRQRNVNLMLAYSELPARETLANTTAVELAASGRTSALISPGSSTKVTSDGHMVPSVPTIGRLLAVELTEQLFRDPNPAGANTPPPLSIPGLSSLAGQQLSNAVSSPRSPDTDASVRGLAAALATPPDNTQFLRGTAQVVAEASLTIQPMLIGILETQIGGFINDAESPPTRDGLLQTLTDMLRQTSTYAQTTAATLDFFINNTFDDCLANGFRDARIRNIEGLIRLKIEEYLSNLLRSLVGGASADGMLTADADKRVGLNDARQDQMLAAVQLMPRCIDTLFRSLTGGRTPQIPITEYGDSAQKVHGLLKRNYGTDFDAVPVRSDSDMGIDFG